VRKITEWLRGLSNNGTASGDSELKTAGLSPSSSAWRIFARSPLLMGRRRGQAGRPDRDHARLPQQLQGGRHSRWQE